MAETVAARAPASPMPKFYRHPLKVLVGRIQTLLMSVVFGHIGVLAIVALYYLLFEVWHPMTVAWHWLINSNYWRHLVRNVGEYFLGTLLVQQIIWNPFKAERKEFKRHVVRDGWRWRIVQEQKPLTKLDRLELRLHITNIRQKHRVTAGQLLASPAIALIYAIPGFFIGAGVIWLLHKGLHAKHLSPILSAHPSFAARLYASSLDQHLVGVLAGIIMGRRPMRKVFQDVQYFFAERRVAKGKTGRAWHPLTFRVLTAQISEQHGQETAIARQAAAGWVPALMVGGLFVLIALAGFGYHVLHDIATATASATG